MSWQTLKTINAKLEGMKFSQPNGLLLCFCALLSLSCAKTKDKDVLSTDDLVVTPWADKPSSTTGWCAVIITKKDDPNVRITLDENSIVACDGVAATVQTTWAGPQYNAFFPKANTLPVRVTVVRPEAGATLVYYTDLH